MKLWPALTAALLALLVLCVQGERAEGTKIDVRPRPALLVGQAGLLVALKADDCLAAYSLEDGTLAHEFQAGDWVQAFDVSADGRFLACSGSGHVSAWDLRSGSRLWQLGPPRSGLHSAEDVSFAWDGRSFVVSDYPGHAAVYDTRTGREVQAVDSPQTPMSAALSPDGSKGVLVDSEGRLYTFEVADGDLTAVGVRAGWPARYSADGKYVACRSKDSGVLRVVKVGEPPSWKDVPGLYPDLIRAAGDGTFLVRVKGAPGGVRYVPATGESEEVWNGKKGEAAREAQDFDPGLMVGVVTRFDLITTLYDLRTGGVRLTIDNSRNYKPHVLSTSHPGSPMLPVLSWAVAAAGVVLALALALCWRLVRRGARRRARAEGPQGGGNP
jgi:WD40 repeat protein